MIQDKKSLLKTDDSLVIRFGLGVLITVFVIFGGWMAFAPLASSSLPETRSCPYLVAHGAAVLSPASQLSPPSRVP